MGAPTPTPFPEIEEFNLERVGQIFFRRWWIIAGTVALSCAAAAAYVWVTPSVYTATALILIEKEEKSRPYADAPILESRAEDYYQTQYRLLKSRSLIKEVYDALELSKVPEFRGGADVLISKVSASPVTRSRLVNISVESFDPKLAARITNKLAETFVAQNLENKLFISKEILETLKSVGEAAGPDAEERYQSLPVVVNNPLIQGLKGRYVNLEAKAGELSSRYTPEHPEFVRLKSEMSAVRSRIREETEYAVKGMKAELSGRLLGNNVRVVDLAEIPTAPSKPRKRLLLVLSIAFGLILGAITSLVLENMDQSIRSQEDVERRLGLAFLGAVTRSDAFLGDFAEDFHKLLLGPESFTGESLKNIRTMIGFASADKRMRKILITSSVQGEGKTFLAINLAMVFAQLGKNVLLIEGDLRRPNLHRRFRLPKENGLSEFLAHGKDTAEMESLISSTPIPKLQVLHCGKIPPNPSELLSTPRLKALLNWAAERFDTIIIDGTPVFPITDALLWSKEVDGTVFVVKFSGVHATMIVKAVQKLREGLTPILGAVINQVTWRSGGYGDYYYNYYHKYYQYSGDKGAKAKNSPA